MADLWNTIASNYITVGTSNLSKTPYVAVDPDLYKGSWSGKYSTNQKFDLAISDVSGFRAKVRYQSGSTVKYQDVLIKDNAFKFGDSKFTLTKQGTAQIRTVVTSPVDGSAVIETAYATKWS